MKHTTTIYKLLFLPVTLLLAGCTDYEADTVDTPEILFRTGVTQVTEGTRATTYDSVEELKAEGSFKCAVYKANSVTSYLFPDPNPAQVDWTGSGDLWEFSGGKKYKWPKQGSLDFFAYFPADMTFYLYSDQVPAGATASAVSYSPTPTFTCKNLSVNTKEFVYAIEKGLSQDGHGETGVLLTFNHVFARLMFKLSDSNTANVTINSITIPDVYCNGTCILGDSPSWSDDISNPQNLVITGTSATAAYLVIPYDYSSNNTVKKTITVNATWHEWSEVTKDVSVSVNLNWKLGKSYNYEITASPDYVIKVDEEKYTEQW